MLSKNPMARLAWRTFCGRAVEQCHPIQKQDGGVGGKWLNKFLEAFADVEQLVRTTTDVAPATIESIE